MPRMATKRLLLVPLSLFAALVIGVQLVETATSRSIDPTLAVDVPTIATEDASRSCARDGDPQRVADIRAALAEDAVVTSTMVLACPAAFDGVAVSYVGEVVGDLLLRDGGAWVLVNDDDYALTVGPLPAHGRHRGGNRGLTVWLPEEFHAEVTGLGRPNQRGDVLAIDGQVVRSDPADGGGLTLRAAEVEVLAAATAVDEPLDVPQLWFALAMLVLAGGSWIVRRRAERG
jgi:hypothetical protein